MAVAISSTDKSAAHSTDVPVTKRRVEPLAG
jgi:hypothetical protein